MSFPLHRTATALLAAALAGLAPGLSRADEPRSDSRAPKPASTSGERASGVILKVDKASSGQDSGTTKERHRGLTLTVNTAAVWRDWVRDQAADRPAESPKTAAREGANSVATKGEPASKDNVVTVHLGPDSKVETRFRAPDDETTKGTKTPEEGADPKGSPRRRPRTYRAEDLKPGLFVEVDYARKDNRNVATTVTVIRPAGVSGTKGKP